MNGISIFWLLFEFCVCVWFILKLNSIPNCPSKYFTLIYYSFCYFYLNVWRIFVESTTPVTDRWCSHSTLLCVPQSLRQGSIFVWIRDSPAVGGSPNAKTSGNETNTDGTSISTQLVQIQSNRPLRFVCGRVQRPPILKINMNAVEMWRNAALTSRENLKCNSLIVSSLAWSCLESVQMAINLPLVDGE